MFQGNVENWLSDLLKGIQVSLHSIIRTSYIALQDPSMKLIEFENSYPSQVGGKLLVFFPRGIKCGDAPIEERFPRILLENHQICTII